MYFQGPPVISPHMSQWLQYRFVLFRIISLEVVMYLLTLCLNGRSEGYYTF